MALLRKAREARTSPFPKMHLSHWLCDRYAERGVAVQDGGSDLEFCDLAIEVACHEALPEQFHAVHLRLGAASAVVSAPLSPDGATEVFRCAKGLVPGDSACRRRFPRLGVLARWYDGMGAPVRDGIMALARGDWRLGNGPVDRFSRERAEP